MTEMLQVYRCGACGNIVEVLHTGDGELVCCGEPMTLMKEKTEDAGREKHVPVIEGSGCETKVKVGSVAHPMEEKHYIEWVEIVGSGGAMKKFLKAGNAPEAEFCTDGKAGKTRGYCNVHGLWTTK